MKPFQLVRVLGVPGAGLLKDLVFSRSTMNSPIDNAGPVEYGEGKQPLPLNRIAISNPQAGRAN
jgi:hypothetical protein